VSNQLFIFTVRKYLLSQQESKKMNATEANTTQFTFSSASQTIEKSNCQLSPESREKKRRLRRAIKACMLRHGYQPEPVDPKITLCLPTKFAAKSKFCGRKNMKSLSLKIGA
jgi:hypothetical protein